MGWHISLPTSLMAVTYKAWKAMVDELSKLGNEASLAKWKQQYPGMFDADMSTSEKCSQCAEQRSKGCIPKNAVIKITSQWAALPIPLWVKLLPTVR